MSKDFLENIIKVVFENFEPEAAPFIWLNIEQKINN